jgi:hypothetical protein
LSIDAKQSRRKQVPLLLPIEVGQK